MKDSHKRIIWDIPIVILIGILVQIGGTYLVNAFCTGVPMLGNKVPAFVLNAIKEYTHTITDLTSTESKMIVYVICVAPMIEEFVFRILFFSNFVKLLPFWASNILQAVLFGLYHGQLVQGLYAFLIGLIIGRVFYSIRQQLSQSLIRTLGAFLFSLLLHMTINASGLYLAPFLPAEYSPAVQVVIGLLCINAVLFLAYVLDFRYNYFVGVRNKNTAEKHNSIREDLRDE